MMIVNRIIYIREKYWKPFNCEKEKMSSGSFENVINKMCLQIIYIYIIYM